MGSDYSGFLKWLYDWQPLITGIMALVAAYVAARPVRQQLSMALLDRLEARVDALESRRRQLRELIGSITSTFLSQLDIYDDGQQPDIINPHWAFNAEQKVGEAIQRLKKSLETSRDGNLIDSERAATIQKCEALSECLWAIHAPSSADFGGPDGPKLDEQATYIEEGKCAERSLLGHIIDVSQAGGKLGEAFEAKIIQLRTRMRRIHRRMRI